LGKADQGVSDNRFAVIPRTLIFLFHGDEVLLIKGNPKKRLWANRYNALGGHIERGEDVLTAARRELKEESGLEVQDLHFCGTVVIETGQEKGILLLVFWGEYQGGELSDSVEGTLEWISLSRIDQYELVEDLPVMVPHVLRHREQRSFFSASYRYDDQDRLIIAYSS